MIRSNTAAEAFGGLRDALFSAESRPCEPGSILGRYRIESILGQGGSGMVYKAYDTELGRWVAIKSVRPERFGSRERARLLREAHATARLTHPGIVTVHEIAEINSAQFMVMEFVEGETLAHLFQKRRLPAEEICRIVEDISRATDHAHRQGIIHRDLKPQNILIRQNGSPVVSDFGLAKLEDSQSHVTQTGYIVGTPLYMSPEQVRGLLTLDARTDIYSLGVILYEGLAGKPPFRGRSPAHIYRQILRRDPDRLADVAPAVPPALEWIVRKCLEKDRRRRYLRASDLADELFRWRTGRRVSARPPSRRERAGRFLRRNRVRLMTAALAGALLTASGLFLTNRIDLQQTEERTQHERRLGELIQQSTRALAGRESLRPVLTELEALSTELPGDARPAAWRGRLLWRLGEEGAAEQVLRQSIQMDPACGVAHFELARITMARYVRMRRMPEMARCGTTLRPTQAPPEAPEAALLRKEANEHIRLARTSDIPRHEIDCLDGYLAYSTFDFTAAAHHFTRYLEQASWDVQVLWVAARAWRHAGRSDKAEELLRRADALLPGSEELLELLARTLLDRQDAEGALELLSKAIDSHPTSALLLQTIGEAHCVAGHQPGDSHSDHHLLSLQALDQALALAPSDDSILQSRGMTLAHLGRHGEAAEEYTRSLELNPVQVVAHVNRAITREAMGDMDGALEDYKIALTMAPDDARTLAFRGKLQARRKLFAEARADLERSVALDDGFTEAWIILGTVQAEEKDYSGSVDAFTRAIAGDPRSVLALFNRGSLWARQNEFERAVEDYTTVLGIDPTHVHARAARASAYRCLARRQTDSAERRSFLLRAGEDFETAYEHSRGTPFAEQVQASLEEVRRALSLP